MLTLYVKLRLFCRELWSSRQECDQLLESIKRTSSKGLKHYICTSAGQRVIRLQGNTFLLSDMSKSNRVIGWQSPYKTSLFPFFSNPILRFHWRISKGYTHFAWKKVIGVGFKSVIKSDAPRLSRSSSKLLVRVRIRSRLDSSENWGCIIIFILFYQKFFRSSSSVHSWHL